MNTVVRLFTSCTVPPRLREAKRSFKAMAHGGPSHNSAAPIRTQCSAGIAVGSSTATTKLVDWPVVESTPARALVLYSGHSYTPLFPAFAAAPPLCGVLVGRKCKTGSGSVCCCGRESVS